MGVIDGLTSAAVTSMPGLTKLVRVIDALPSVAAWNAANNAGKLPWLPAAKAATGTYECLCKGCGFEVCGEPALAVYCHCQSCRVFGGDAARVAAYPPDQFKLTKGDDKLLKYESAPGKWRHSCNTCGSFVHNVLPNGLMIAPLGGCSWAEDGEPVVPNKHIFMGDCGLEKVTDALPQHAAFPGP
jgi:hypothetical protein